MMSKRKRIAFVSITVLVLALILTVVYSELLAGSVKKNLSRVACLGDSITEETLYPEELQTLLGDASVVGNFGVSGATVNLWSDKPYFYEPTYRSSRDFLPSTAIFMLGANDARTNNYEKIVNFTVNYERLLNRTQRWNTTDQIYVVVPPPIFDNALDLNGTFYAQEVVPRIHQVAENKDLPVIDVYTPLVNHPEYFPDGVHPNEEGAKIIARLIYDAIK